MKEKVSSVRIEPEIDRVLHLASAATGKTRGEMINEALRRHLADLVEETTAGQKKAYEELQGILPHVSTGRRKARS